MICKFQFPWNERIPSFSFSLSFFFSFYTKRWNGSRVTTRLDNRCYVPIFTPGIFRVSIETCNILSLHFKIFPDSFKGLAHCYCGRETSSSLFFSFFFFFYDTLSLEFPYITRVVYIIVSTQCCYYRIEIRFNTLQGRIRWISNFFRPVTRCLFRFPRRIIIFLYKIDRSLE